MYRPLNERRRGPAADMTLNFGSLGSCPDTASSDAIHRASAVSASTLDVTAPLKALDKAADTGIHSAVPALEIVLSHSPPGLSPAT